MGVSQNHAFMMRDDMRPDIGESNGQQNRKYNGNRDYQKLRVSQDEGYLFSRACLRRIRVFWGGDCKKFAEVAAGLLPDSLIHKQESWKP